jgi:hypothetical protein
MTISNTALNEIRNYIHLCEMRNGSRQLRAKVTLTNSQRP